MNLEFLQQHGFQEVNDMKIEIILPYFNGFNIEKNFLIPDKYSENIAITLSKQYGLGFFPYHTDGSHKKIPPRYVILEYLGVQDSVCATLLFDINIIKDNVKYENFLYNEIYLVRGGALPFLSPIINRQLSDMNLLRWNMLTMKKQIDRTKISFGDFDDNFHYKIKWAAGKILIIDNWRLLHSRERVPASEVNTRFFNRYYLTKQYGSI